MKREINCTECAKAWARVIGLRTEQEARLVRKHGAALLDFVCDCCGIPLAAGGHVVCVSVFTRDHPYFEWESEAVRLFTPEEQDAVERLDNPG